MAALWPEICRDHNRSSGHFDRGSNGIMDLTPKDLLVVPMEILWSWDHEFCLIPMCDLVEVIWMFRKDIGTRVP